MTERNSRQTSRDQTKNTAASFLFGSCSEAGSPA